jgi:hypothetical protein
MHLLECFNVSWREHFSDNLGRDLKFDRINQSRLPRPSLIHGTISARVPH